MLGNARFERIRETSISVASHYAEVVFVKKRHRIGDLKCKRNYQAGNLLRHSRCLACFTKTVEFAPVSARFDPSNGVRNLSRAEEAPAESPIGYRARVFGK